MKKRLSDRVTSIEESATLAMAAKAAAYKSQGFDIINLSLGEPDFKTPKYICEAAKKAIDEAKYFSYPPVAGYLDLREAIAEKYTQCNHVPYQANNVVVSNGAKQSIANALLALLEPSDEVIVLSPFWVSYDALVRLTGAKPIFVKGEFEQKFKATAEQIEAAITPKTRAIIFSSPCNPTGSTFSRAELQNIARIVLKHKNIMVVADEIYEYINFSDDRISIASFPGMFERTVTINGCSKGFAMTGWRVGYMAAPEWLAKGCIKIQGQITSANSSIAQRAALAAISGDLKDTTSMVAEYKRRRAVTYELLRQIPNIKVTLPEGAFYFFPDVSHYYTTLGDQRLLSDGQQLCMYILDKAHVSLVPGGAFGEEKCIRLSYATSIEKLKEAIKRISDLLLSLKQA